MAKPTQPSGPSQPLPDYRPPEQMLGRCRTCGQMVLKHVFANGQIRWETPALGYEHVCQEEKP